MEFEVLCSTPPGAKRKLHFSLRKTLLFMKLLVLFTVVACLQARSNGYSQTITISVKNAPLEKVFREIRKQSAYSFIYTKEELSRSHAVSIEVKDGSIEDVLIICMQDQPLSYTIEGDHVVIKKKKEEVITAHQQNEILLIDVRGRVVNEKGEPVEGATVSVKGTKNITSTDNNGYFILKGVEENAVLVITGINVDTYEVVVNGKTDLSTIHLKTRISKLDEIQVIGYGTNTQRYNVGSVTKITAEEISKQAVFNPLAALQGRVPGLVVTSTSGLPGSSFNIQIRGQNSLNPDPNLSVPPLDNPLFIIDGVPFAPQNSILNQFKSILSPGSNTTLNNPTGGVSPFASINPADIESIEVLRDADATAIYGSRGANGVILITTKRGIAGKTKVNLNVYQSASFVPYIMPMMNTEQYLQMRREAFKNDGITPDVNPGNTSSYAPDLLIFDSTKYTDWKDYFIGGSAKTTDVNASVSGGSHTTQFLIGTGFHSDGSITPGNFSNTRVSMNINLHHSSTDRKFFLDFSSNYSYNQNSFSAGGIATPNFLMAYSLPPNYPDLLDSNSNIVWNYKGISLGGTGTAANPYSFLLKKYEVKINNSISNLQLGYHISPAVSIRSSFGFNSLYSDEYSGNPANSQDPNRTVIGSADFGTNNTSGWIIEPQAEYNTTVGNGKLNLLAGGTFQKNINSLTTINASGYSNDALIESISGAPIRNATDAYTEYKYNAIFGRLGYLLAKKYILNLTGRRDGSSRFGPGKQFGNFGSLAGGWLFSEEKFIKKSIAYLSYGKLHISYGSTGNDKIGDYQFISRWSPTLYAFQNALGYAPQNLFNPDFSWGVTRKLEAGIELGFFKDRIFFSATWFRNRSGNQLVQYPLPTQTGFINVIENLGALVENKGLEIQMNSTNIKGKNFNWNTSFNITVPQNKLLSFPGLDHSSYAGRYFIGQPLSALSKFIYLGVNDTTGIFQFLSADKSATYSPLAHSGAKFRDEKIIGDLDPKFYGGLSNNFSYKRFELNIFIEFKKQIGINYLGQIYSSFIPGQQSNLPTTLLSRWQSQGDHAEYQRLTSSGSSPAALAARFYFLRSGGVYSDASYIRFKTVSLSYSVSNKVLNKLPIEGCRIYISSQNLFTITRYKGNDPETQSFYGIPPLRTIATGIQFNF
jgi:TonB-dependent starch-binding outer membrane protein SusC